MRASEHDPPERKAEATAGKKLELIRLDVYSDRENERS